MKPESTIKRVFRPSWTAFAALAAIVCAVLLVVTKSPKNSLKEYSALPLVESAQSQAAFSAPADEAAVPAPESARAEEPLSPPVDITIELPPPARKRSFNVWKKFAQKDVKRPAKRTAKHKKKKRVWVAEAEKIIAAPNQEATAEEVLQAFSWLAEASPKRSLAKQKTVRLPEALEKLADRGLSEAPLLSEYSDAISVASSVVAAKVPEKAPELELPVIERNSLIFAEFKKSDFVDVREKLGSWHRQLGQLEVAVSQPAERMKQELTYKANEPLEAEVAEESEDSQAQIVKPEIALAPSEPINDGPTLVDPKKAAPAVETAAVANSMYRLLSPAKEPLPTQTTQKPAATQSAETKKPANTPTIEVAVNERTASKKALLRSDAVVDDVSSSSEPETVFGRFSVDPMLDAELTNRAGHIELHLIAADRKDVQISDTKFVDYRYPSEEFGDRFEIPAGTLHGVYRLFARIYFADDINPVSIPYRRSKISAQLREQVKFHVTKQEYDYYRQFVSNVPSNDLVLHLSVFEGLQGNPKQPTRIGNARVTIVGFPEWGAYTTDKDGNVRVPKIPRRSELLVSVSHDKYFPTETVVPVFSADPHAVVYLVPKATVTNITDWITKSLQREDRAVITGRVYDPISRKPLVGESLELQYRKGPALYINALPDLSLKSTASTGLFAFFNVIPSIRSIIREVGSHWAPLINFKAGYGYFLEFGRGGKRNIRGKLFDTLNKYSPDASIYVVNNEITSVQTESGSFELENVDLPKGILSLEVKSPRYPLTIHTIPFDTIDSNEEKKLFMLDEKWLKDAHQDFAKIGQLDREKGSVVGGAEESLFAGARGCAKVELLDQNGKPIALAHGPFTWGKEKSGRQLCLSASNPRFAFYNLPPGQYILKWRDQANRILRSHVFFVGKERITMAIN